MTINLLDGVLLVLCTTAGVFAYKAGLLKKAISLPATVIAVVIGIRLMGPVGGTLARWGIFSPGFSALLVFLLAVVLLLALTWYCIRRFAPKSSSKRPGRITATLLGVLEAGFLLSVALLVLKFLDLPDAHTRNGSALYRPMVNIAPWSFDALRSALPGGERVEEELTPERRPGP